MSVVVRFAPSPTGFLHIGGARTALFNWLFARHHGGRYLLRIEDTDRERSTAEAIEAIFDGLGWLGLTADEAESVVFQSGRLDRHRAVVMDLLERGHAYRCYASQAELEEMRQRAREEKRPMRYDGRWRDRDPAEAPAGVDPVIRLKAPQDGLTVIEDLVQGRIEVANAQLDDMILLRSDGSPTYMCSVVVDDIDMGITHVIRGDDHLTNAFRQTLLYEAIGAPVPRFAHIPLIHGPDGAKLSKRHGAVSVTEYRHDGILAEAMRNYLLRLGWSHGDDEIIDTADAIRWFDLDAVGRSAARFDMARLLSLNAHYMREMGDAELIARLRPFLERGDLDLPALNLDEAGLKRLEAGMAGLKSRARTLIELAQMGAFYIAARPLALQDKAARLLDEPARAHLAAAHDALAHARDWQAGPLEAGLREVAEARGIGFGKLAQPMRSALTGTTVSPGLFEVMEVLGPEETLARLDDAAKGRNGRAERPH